MVVSLCVGGANVFMTHTNHLMRDGSERRALFSNFKKITMEQIFNQAVGDLLSTRLSTPTSESYIYKGVKIIKDDNSIKILNTKFNGDYYQEVTKEEYAIFEKSGWRVGCYLVATRNNRKALNIISEKIQEEIKTMKNLKRYNMLVRYRDVVIHRFVTTLELLRQ